MDGRRLSANSPGFPPCRSRSSPGSLARSTRLAAALAHGFRVPGPGASTQQRISLVIHNKAGLLLAAALGLATACERADETAADRATIAAEIRAQVEAAYDLSRPDAVQRLMSLYPDSGPVYSAGAGRFTSSRDSLERGIHEFWENVGLNMREPRWEWTAMEIEVLSPTSAVMTTTYRVPHFTPRNEPHVLAGAWTAVFARRDGRWVIVHEHLSDVPVGPDTTAPADAGSGDEDAEH